MTVTVFCFAERTAAMSREAAAELHRMTREKKPVTQNSTNAATPPSHRLVTPSSDDVHAPLNLCGSCDLSRGQ